MMAMKTVKNRLLSFNRYIVECKCGNLINMALDKFSFNRYIVECKCMCITCRVAVT